MSLEGTHEVKQGFAQMLKGGIVMDVTNVEEAKVAERAGVRIERNSV
jgi:pyridoxal 5'-phosphate synthase pdxS subunit